MNRPTKQRSFDLREVEFQVGHRSTYQTGREVESGKRWPWGKPLTGNYLEREALR